MSNELKNKLTPIINSTKGTPTIVNEKSTFVVVTYWWGRGVDNANTARPCIAFYEELLNSFNKYINNLINTIIKTKNIKKDDYQKIITSIYNKVYFYLNDPSRATYSELDRLIQKFATMYMNSIYDYCNIPINSSNMDDNALKWLEKLKEQGKTPANFEYKNKAYVEKIFRMVLKEALKANKDNIISLYLVNNQMDNLKYTYGHNDDIYKKSIQELNFKINYFKENDSVYKCAIEADSSQTIENLEIKILEEEQKFLLSTQSTKLKITKLNDKKKEIKDKIKSTLKNKSLEYSTESGFPSGQSIIDILISELRYQSPLKFEQMIERWEKNCRDNKCNYLAIEYPEFTAAGGYQLAINAKPMFIQKALELCPGRSVLYIDGDMNIRKYPGIFDYSEIDYMARGWWIDPRSSYKMEESITYDPYIFETSGGTMFFSQSPESKKLIDIWIETAESPYQVGKADDRIISLVFNTKSVLTWLRVIQLPIEYLWLTLDYDERMLEMVYDYDKVKMEDSIFIDHPECLTSEDTASGAGASSDRQPMFYSFIEHLTPCTELVHEYILFRKLIENRPELRGELVNRVVTTTDNLKNEIDTDIKAIDKNIVNDISNQAGGEPDSNQRDYLPFLKNYYEFMDGVVYIDDGNEELEEFGLIDPENPENNEQPLYITKYDDKFGTKKYPGEDVSYNELVEINIKRANQMNLESLYKENEIVNNQELNCVEIQNPNNQLPPNKVISLIYRLLSEGKSVLYNPIKEQGYNPALYTSLLSKLTGTAGMYKYCNFIFNPDITSQRKSNFFKPKIMYNQPIFFRPDSYLLDFLSMQISLESLSEMINKGSYEFMSLVRVAYYFMIKGQRGGGKNKPQQILDKYIEDYENEMEKEELVPTKQVAGKRNKKTRRKKGKSKTKKRSRSNRK